MILDNWWNCGQMGNICVNTFGHYFVPFLCYWWDCFSSKMGHWFFSRERIKQQLWGKSITGIIFRWIWFVLQFFTLKITEENYFFCVSCKNLLCMRVRTFLQNQFMDFFHFLSILCDKEIKSTRNLQAESVNWFNIIERKEKKGRTRKS